ncbi:MAG: aminoacyl-tRNA hydrolase [Dehalogenimonas sp.]
MKLIIGLGNPGREYSGTRHNVGFAIMGVLARKHGINFNKRSCRSKIGEGRLEDVNVALAKPQTYMNLSGEAISALLRRYRLKPNDIIVVYDDLDLPVGRIRIRTDGNAGGHNGLKSIIAALGTNKFIRLKVGIGRPTNAIDQKEIVDHVLSGFDKNEHEAISNAVDRAVQAIELLVTENPETAMNLFN